MATPRDAADRHVAALAAVEEVEVEWHGLAVAPEARPAAAGPSRRRTGPCGAPRRSRAPRRRRGRAATHTSGSTRVTATARRPHLRGRQDAELGDPVRVGFVRRALVDGLGLAHDAVRADLAGLRHQRARHDRSSSCRYSSSSSTTRNSCVVVCSDPRTRPTLGSSLTTLAHPLASPRRGSPGTRGRGRPSGDEARARARRWEPGSAARAGQVRLGRDQRQHGGRAVRHRATRRRSGASRYASQRTTPVHEWPPGSRRAARTRSSAGSP